MRYNTIQTNLNFASDIMELNPEILTAGEFFAGGGGWTEGVHKIPNVKTKWILNHDKVALKTNAFHHPEVKVYWADIFTQDEHELEYVDYVHASVECTQHSNANGGREKKTGSYVMGWELYRYIKFLQPMLLSIENVPEFKKWAPLDKKGKPIKAKAGQEFERWKKALQDLGYEYAESIRNAADDGLPTRRVRYFGVFYRPGMAFKFPGFTHSKHGGNGKLKWNPCRPHLDLQDEGISIFGRQFNEKLPKHMRKPLSPHSLERIANGAMKYSPDFRNFIAHFYGGSPNRFQSIESPLNTISTANRHQLITMEKLRFIADHCHSDQYQKIDLPLKTQTTRQTKQLITIDQFLCQYYGSINTQSLEDPIKTISTKDRHQLIRLEKAQFLVKYIGSNPKYANQSIESPLSNIETERKHQLITILDNFEIKARFLRPDELSGCSTFPRDYFNRPGLKLSSKDAVKMIGNAVPPDWAAVIMGPNIESILEYKLKKQSA